VQYLPVIIELFTDMYQLVHGTVIFILQFKKKILPTPTGIHRMYGVPVLVPVKNTGTGIYVQ
jgi:hypothetical protein